MAQSADLTRHVRNIRLLVEYDGSRYHGWQWQDGQATIQGALIGALEKMTGTRPVIWVAGRTDAGVSALAQVANFHTESTILTYRFATGLNALLPPDISVHRAEDVPMSFNSKVDSLAKRYRYRVYQGPQRSALEPRAWHIKRRLDLEAMQRAAAHLIGELDFESFRSTECDAEHAVRRMISITIERSARPPVGEVVEITFHANAFLRHMCRILSGTLVEVGMGRRSSDDVAAALAARDRTRAGMTAPPFGLTLLEVMYPP
jgi:tRNA pseudouridine38-40 synthase